MSCTIGRAGIREKDRLASVANLKLFLLASISFISFPSFPSSPSGTARSVANRFAEELESGIVGVDLLSNDRVGIRFASLLVLLITRECSVSHSSEGALVSLTVVLSVDPAVRSLLVAGCRLLLDVVVPVVPRPTRSDRDSDPVFPTSTAIH